MTLEERTQQLWQAADQRKICRLLIDGEPFPRIIHPYGVSQTQRNQITLVCWQTMGFTKAGGKEGYRNLALAKITSIEILNSDFQKRTDFHPEDSQYKDWVFHI